MLYLSLSLVILAMKSLQHNMMKGGRYFCTGATCCVGKLLWRLIIKNVAALTDHVNHDVFIYWLVLMVIWCVFISFRSWDDVIDDVIRGTPRSTGTACLQLWLPVWWGFGGVPIIFSFFNNFLLNEIICNVEQNASVKQTEQQRENERSWGSYCNWLALAPDGPTSKLAVSLPATALNQLQVVTTSPSFRSQPHQVDEGMSLCSVTATTPWLHHTSLLQSRVKIHLPQAGISQSLLTFIMVERLEQF